jgi:hypothetical protein
MGGSVVPAFPPPSVPVTAGTYRPAKSMVSVSIHGSVAEFVSSRFYTHDWCCTIPMYFLQMLLESKRFLAQPHSNRRLCFMYPARKMRDSSALPSGKAELYGSSHMPPILCRRRFPLHVPHPSSPLNSTHHRAPNSSHLHLPTIRTTNATALPNSLHIRHITNPQPAKNPSPASGTH